jgi:hypothetical protein
MYLRYRYTGVLKGMPHFLENPVEEIRSLGFATAEVLGDLFSPTNKLKFEYNLTLDLQVWFSLFFSFFLILFCFSFVVFTVRHQELKSLVEWKEEPLLPKVENAKPEVTLETNTSPLFDNNDPDVLLFEFLEHMAQLHEARVAAASKKYPSQANPIDEDDSWLLLIRKALTYFMNVHLQVMMISNRTPWMMTRLHRQLVRHQHFCATASRFFFFVFFGFLRLFTFLIIFVARILL